MRGSNTFPVEPMEFVARMDADALRSRPLNRGRNRLGGRPFLVSTQAYDRSTDAERAQQEEQVAMIARAEAKTRAAEEAKAARASKASKAAQSTVGTDPAVVAAAAAGRTMEHVRRLETERKQQQEERARLARPKPLTQCVMRGVPRVTPTRDLRAMFENFGPVRRVSVIKTGGRGGEGGDEDGAEGAPTTADDVSELVDPALRSELMSVSVVFEHSWAARKALSALSPTLQWSPLEKSQDTRDSPAPGGDRLPRWPYLAGPWPWPLAMLMRGLAGICSAQVTAGAKNAGAAHRAALACRSGCRQ